MSSETTQDHAETIDARLDELVRSLCIAQPEQLTDELELVTDLGYDSLGLLELVTAIEVEFSIDHMPEDEALDVQTVGDLRRLLVSAGVQ